eukprot:TRINITY_DN3915_c0_g1_i2.p1 TRINITY_DN3915_c0_g1~~TRINITY_DN3915_c0_g1_i2.p1  ORF type:complete len:392 (-),score=92.31 TRINITY_DN3915_c0_g1_i2:154-1329(-)
MERAYKATVVGAGPGGIAVVATLLDIGVKTISWIDPEFKGGKLQMYREIPSNTKVKTFIEYSTLSKTLNGFCSSSNPINPVEEMSKLDREKTCSLGATADYVHKLIDNLRKNYSQNIHFKRGWLNEAAFERDSSVWKLKMNSLDNQSQDNTFSASNLFLTTGSRPSQGTYHIRCAGNKKVDVLDLYTALTPSKLKKAVTKNDVVAVVGSSHSAVLVLKNLLELPSEVRPKLIKNFYRSPFKYAIFYDDWILYDNTGLKGVAATWTKETLDGKNVEGLNRYQVDQAIEDEVYRRELPECTKIIYAVGFERDELPKLRVGGKEVHNSTYNNKSGEIQLFDENKAELRTDSIYGYGIAYPEFITDRAGNQEYNVGLFKFMRYLQRVLPPMMQGK